MDKIESAKKYFEAYPAENVIHVTSDGQVFLHRNQNDAVNHQRRLDERTKVQTMFRKEVFVSPKVEEDGGPGLPDESWTKKDITAWINAQGVGVQATGKEKKEDLLAMVDKVIESAQTPSDDPEKDETNAAE